MGNRPVRRRIALLVLLCLHLALLAGCAETAPVTASPSAPPPSPTVAVPPPPPPPPATPTVPATASPTAERARATFGTIVIAVTYVPTPTPYAPPLLATATAASVGFPASIAAAEAEGAAHPRLDPPSQAPDTFANAPGDTARRCVPVERSDTRGVRSGGFAAGPFNYFYDTWRQHGESKVWWVPEHPLRGVNIIVRGVRLETPAETVRQEIVPNSPTFFPSLVALPRGGTWLLVVTGSPNWGCFVLTLPDE